MLWNCYGLLLATRIRINLNFDYLKSPSTLTVINKPSSIKRVNICTLAGTVTFVTSCTLGCSTNLNQTPFRVDIPFTPSNCTGRVAAHCTLSTPLSINIFPIRALIVQTAAVPLGAHPNTLAVTHLLLVHRWVHSEELTRSIVFITAVVNWIQRDSPKSGCHGRLSEDSGNQGHKKENSLWGRSLHGWFVNADNVIFWFVSLFLQSVVWSVTKVDYSPGTSGIRRTLSPVRCFQSCQSDFRFCQTSDRLGWSVWLVWLTGSPIRSGLTNQTQTTGWNQTLSERFLVP